MLATDPFINSIGLGPHTETAVASGILYTAPLFACAVTYLNHCTTYKSLNRVYTAKWLAFNHLHTFEYQYRPSNIGLQVITHNIPSTHT